MASLKRCLGVDLGSSAVKIADLKREGNAVRVMALLSRDLDVGPAATPEERAEATATAVRDLIKENKIATKQAVFCVPGQAVFVKRVRLPRTSEERLHRIINYEARQQIPFPLDKTLLEFQVFDEPGDPQVEVLLVAIKRDFVESYMRTVAKCKLRALEISVSSLALFNYHHFEAAADELMGLVKKAETQPGKAKGGFKLSFGKKKKAEAAEPEPDGHADLDTLPPETGEDDAGLGEGAEEFDLGDMDMGIEDVKAYLSIGASTLDIVIARFGKRRTIGFTRSVPIAGNEITRMIKDRLKLESFPEAEEVKRSKTAILLDDRERPGEVNPEASAAATQLANRLVAEVRRTLDFYVSQPDGVTVDSVVLSGGSSKLPNLSGYIEEKIGLMVETFEAPKTERLAFDAAPAEGWGGYLPALGLALTGLGLGKIEIDFLPSNLKDVRQFKGKLTEIAVLAACLGVSVYFGTKMGRSDIEWYTNQVNRMRDRLEATRPNIQAAEAALAQRRSIKGEFESLAQLLGWREYWPKIYLEVINTYKPPQIFLTQLDCTAYGQIRIRGRSFDPNAIAAFASNIRQNAGDFIQTGNDPVTDQPLVQVYTQGDEITPQGEVTIFEIFMLAVTKRESHTVPYRNLAQPVNPALLQNQPGAGGFGQPFGGPQPFVGGEGAALR